MKKPVASIISVPTPCQEGWDNMTPADKGRFCASCQKTVIDFTVMTDAEVLQTFRRLNNNVCGHFFADQLNREIKYAQPAPWWKPVLQKLVAGVLLFQSFVVNAQVPLKKKAVTTQKNVDKNNNASYIHGHVYHYNTTVPVSNVCVSISGTDITATTDAKGRFRLPLPASADSHIMLVAQVAPTLDTFFVEQQQVLLADVKAGKEVILYGYYEKKIKEIVIKTYGRPLVEGGGKVETRFTVEEIRPRRSRHSIWYWIAKPFQKKEQQ